MVDDQSENGAQRTGLTTVAGLGYRTAWMMLHKLRSSMVRPGQDMLTGTIEVDVSCVGGLKEGIRGRGTEKKALIVVAAQENGQGIGRIRAAHIADASAASLHGFVETTIEPGSTIHTDDWTGYQGLEAKGYQHVGTPIKNSGKTAHELLPLVYKVISLFKRWLLGTHQGAISHEHMSSYLNEFVFRFNRRTSAYRGKLFLHLAQQATAVEPLPYARLVKGVRENRSYKHNNFGVGDIKCIPLYSS